MLGIERDETSKRLARMERARKSNPLISWISLGTGGTAILFSGLTFYLGDRAYNDYMESNSMDDLLIDKARFQRWDTVTSVSWGIGGFGVALFGVLRLITPPRKR